MPVVALRAAFMGGLLAEDADSSGLTAFLASMWLRGTRSHSAAGFAAAVEERAAEIDTYSGRSSFGLTLEVPSAELAPALDLACEILLEPAFDASELERERQETLAASCVRTRKKSRRHAPSGPASRASSFPASVGRSGDGLAMRAFSA